MKDRQPLRKRTYKLDLGRRADGGRIYPAEKAFLAPQRDHIKQAMPERKRVI